MKNGEKSIDLRVMEIVKDFDYLISIGQTMTMNELKHRAESVPGIMDEPDLQFLSQCASKSTIKLIKRNYAGYWYQFHQ